MSDLNLFDVELRKIVDGIYEVFKACIKRNNVTSIVHHGKLILDFIAFNVVEKTIERSVLISLSRINDELYGLYLFHLYSGEKIMNREELNLLIDLNYYLNKFITQKITLRNIKKLDWTEFEDFCSFLISNSNYSRVHQTPRTGDGGV